MEKEIEKKADSAPTLESDPRHPIQVVSRRTGLSADVIRVWERRYSVVEPARGAGGRRVYSDKDIRRLSLLQTVTHAGRRISDVAELDDESLMGLAAEDRKGSGLPFSGGGANAQTHITYAMQAIEDLDADRLRKVIASAASELPLQVFLEQMLAPLLRQIGVAWKDGDIRVGHEHMSSIVIRHYLMGMRNTSINKGPAIVFATPSGYQHELGILIAAIIADSEGWRSIYLGPELPAEEIAAIVEQSNAGAVVLGLQSTLDDSLVLDELTRLRTALSPEVQIFLGGSGAIKHQEQLQSLPAFVVRDLSEFREALSTAS